MELSAWYDKVGGDYSDVLKRLRDNARIIRFLSLFPKDDTYQLLVNAFNSSEWKDAFRYAHTLKGLAQNLGLKSLAESASLLTDSLREGYESGLADVYFKATEEAYNTIISSFKDLPEA